ncbi:protein ORF20A [Goose adenovirus 4]|nr:protein ORF20A [Goose adenovirus 4]
MPLTPPSVSSIITVFVPSVVFGSVILNSIIFVLADLDYIDSKYGNALIYAVSCISIIIVVCLLCWVFSRDYNRFARDFMEEGRNHFVRLLRRARAEENRESDNHPHSDPRSNEDHPNRRDDEEDPGNGGFGTSSSFPIPDSSWRWWRSLYSGSPTSVTWSANPIYGALTASERTTSQDSGIASGLSSVGSSERVYVNVGSLSDLSPSRCPRFSPPPIPINKSKSGGLSLVSPYAVTPLCSITPASSIPTHNSDYDRPSSYLIHC